MPTLKMSPLMIFFTSTIIVNISTIVHGLSLYKQKPVLTIKTEKGQVYDCVDFYKQPTFNDPFLKKHIQKINQTYLQNQVGEVKNLGLKDGGCPLGTVPILRMMDVLKYPSNSTRNGEHCTAVVRTRSYEGRSFSAATGRVSLYKFKLNGMQWSSSRMKFLNGIESIEAGWMVNAPQFSDSEAHFYARFKVGAKGCVNLLCQGFVQVSKSVALGAIPDRYSHIGGSDIYWWEISIEQHQDDENWWLSIGSDKVTTTIGYWPKSLFTVLGNSATQIEWGGEINNLEPDLDPLPYMGSGFKARDDTKLSACYLQVKAVENHLTMDPPKDTENFEDCGAYTTYDAGDRGTPFGRLIYYGGPKK